VFFDQEKAWTNTFGEAELKTVEKNLLEMKEHVLKAHNHTGEFVKCRFIVEGSPAGLTAERRAQIELIVAGYNKDLGYDIAKHVQEGKAKGGIEILLQPVKANAVAGVFSQAAKEALQHVDRPKCKCGFRLVHLNPLFRCGSTDGQHDSKFRGSIRLQPLRAAGCDRRGLLVPLPPLQQVHDARHRISKGRILGRCRGNESPRRHPCHSE
jgi:hypothetical protein